MREKDMKAVAVIGYNGVDVTVYLAMLLMRVGKTVAICDKSPQKEVLTVFLPGDEFAPSAESNRLVVFTENDDCPEEMEYIVYYFGYDAGHADVEKCEVRLLVTDMLPEHAKALRPLSNSFFGRIEDVEDRRDEDGEEKEESANAAPVARATETHMLIKDMTHSKYGKRYLVALTKQEIPKKHLHTLMFNEKDFNVRLNIGHKKLSLSPLSEYYKEFLNVMIQKITGEELTRKTKKLMYK